MTATVNRRIVLAARPNGEPGAEHFRLEEAPLPNFERGRFSCAPYTCRSIHI